MIFKKLLVHQPKSTVLPLHESGVLWQKWMERCTGATFQNTMNKCSHLYFSLLKVIVDWDFWTALCQCFVYVLQMCRPKQTRHFVATLRLQRGQWANQNVTKRSTGFRKRGQVVVIPSMLCGALWWCCITPSPAWTRDHHEGHLFRWAWGC